MASDGKITIDFDLNDKASEKLDDFTKKAGQTGQDSKEKMEKPFKDPITAKLVAQAKKEGISNFRSLLKEIPEKQKTDLLAKAQKGEAINFQKELKKIPNKVLSKVELNDNASPGLKRLQQESKKTEISFGGLKNIIKGTFAGNLAFQAAAKGVQLVTGAVGDAIKRVDTLNNSNRAYENMGIKASDAAEANKMLQKAIDGLPTALDSATRSQQLLTSSMNNDVKGATDVFRALNDGILGFGGSAEQVDQAVLQVSQSFSNGKVDAQTWNSMLNAQLGPTLNALAKQMGKTTGELKDGLSDGTISVEQFQQGLINLDKNGGGGLKSLQKIAKDSTGGIGTSMQNLNTAIVRGVGNVIQGLQKAGLSKVLDNMRNAIDGLKNPATKLGEVLGGLMNWFIKLSAPIAEIIGLLWKSEWKTFSTIIGDIVGALKDFGEKLGLTKDKGDPVVGVLKDIAGNKKAIELLGGALGTLAAGMVIYKAYTTAAAVATATWAAVTNAAAIAAKVMTAAQWALNVAMDANPIGLIIAAVALLAVGFYELYKHCKPFRKFVDKFLKSAGKVFSDFGKTADSAIKGVKKVISDVLDTISGVWNGTWSGLGSFFGDIWEGIKQTAANGINFVIDVINSGVDAIDKVWKFFSGHETSIKHLKHVKFANGGTVGEEQMAMINDGGGSNWKELLEFPDGSVGMSEKKNHVLPLPTGTRVYNGEETKTIMEKAGIKKYANGGIVGSVLGAAKGAVDWTVDTAKGVGEWAGDKYNAVVKFLKDPLKNVTNMIAGAISGITKKMGNFADFATGAWKNMYSPIADWFKKGIEGIKDSLGRNAPNGSGVNRWSYQVKDALKANGMSTDSWAVNKILKQISTESGGNEKAVQGGYTDVNTKTGDLAKGLMQTISATFNRYAHPGHNNILNGYDNLLAAIAYIKNRYGTNMSGIGEGHGYAEGGWANKPSIFGEVPGQPEVAINPSKPNADHLIVEAMQARAEKNPNGFSASMLKMANGVKSNSRPADGSLGVTSTNGSVIGKKSDSSQGNVNVSFNIDSTEVARKTYPMIKFLQNSDIQLNALTRGGSYGTL